MKQKSPAHPAGLFCVRSGMKRNSYYGAHPVGVLGLAFALCLLLALARWVHHLPWAQWWQWLTHW